MGVSKPTPQHHATLQILKMGFGVLDLDSEILKYLSILYNMTQIHRCGVDRRGVVTRFHIHVKNFHISLL